LTFGKGADQAAPAATRDGPMFRSKASMQPYRCRFAGARLVGVRALCCSLIRFSTNGSSLGNRYELLGGYLTTGTVMRGRSKHVHPQPGGFRLSHFLLLKKLSHWHAQAAGATGNVLMRVRVSISVALPSLPVLLAGYHADS
jgi:hypothetical protein